MNGRKLTGLGVLLKDALDNIALHDRYAESLGNEPTLHAPDMANGLLFAYEQLRNVSENIENHLLLQSAISRFYKRNLSFGLKRSTKDLAQELVIELTQAEYRKNDTTPLSKVKLIDSYIQHHYDSYWKIIKKERNVHPDTARRWILQLLTVKTEQVFNNPVRTLSFAAFAYTHFNELIPVADFVSDGEEIEESDQTTILYMAIHKALLKSNDANIRSAITDLYGVESTAISHLVQINKKIDHLTNLKTTAKISRLVSKNGAPLRILYATFFRKQTDVHSLDIYNEALVLGNVEARVTDEYRQVQRNVRQGVVKSIIFLLITKALIGLFIEIPYDLLVEGMILIVPLVINLVFPPLFIAITALTFKMPSEVNKRAIVEYVKGMLYESSDTPSLKFYQPTGRSYFFNTVYALMFLSVFYFVILQLSHLEFNIVQGIIFFVFLSTASFLGYRLTLQIRELEIISRNLGFIILLRDFLYAPFIFVGRHISYRFARMNIIAQLLDIVIELPLKTVLRLLRQWSAFLNNKKDELL